MADLQVVASPGVDKPPAKSRAKPPLLLILIALSSMGSLVVSGMVLMSRTHALPAASQTDQHQAELPVVRHELGEFLVNLSDPDGEGYVKASIVVESEADDSSAGSQGKKEGEGEKKAGEGEKKAEWEPPVRDAIISILSQSSRQELRVPNGKEALKKRILTRINSHELREVPKFTAVYFTSFAMQ